MPGQGGEIHDGFRERRFAAFDGLSLYFRDYGDSLSLPPPVLCLPGLTRNAKDFHKLALSISRKRRVLCPDYCGRGRSQYAKDWRRYSIVACLEDLRHLLAVCNVHKVVVIGVSMGGIMAAAMAAAYPCFLAGVLLDDIGPEINQAGVERIGSYMQDDQARPDWPSAIGFVKKAFPNASIKDEEGWLEMAKNTFRQCADGRLRFDWDQTVIKAMNARHRKNADYWPLFMALARIPVLAIRGEESDILPEATFGSMARRLENIRQATIPHVGHAPNLQEPEALQPLNEFLALTE